MNEDIGHEVIEEITPTPDEDIGHEVIEEITPTPEEEIEGITELNIESYDLGTFSTIGMTSSGVLVMVGIGIGVIIKILKRL